MRSHPSPTTAAICSRSSTSAARSRRAAIPVEVDLEATPERFETIVSALREAGVNVIRAGAERYGEELSVVLVGDLVETDLSDTLSRVEQANAAVADVALSAPAGTDEPSSARLRLATETGQRERALDTVRELADEKDLHLVEPLAGGDR